MFGFLFSSACFMLQSLLAAGRLLEPIEVPTQRIQRILQNALLPLKLLASASFEKDRLAYLELERIYQVSFRISWQAYSVQCTNCITLLVVCHSHLKIRALL